MEKKGPHFINPLHINIPMPTSASPLPIWRPEACIPRKEILEGKLTDAELALRLSTVISGQAKPPYNDPETFYEATHLTRNMKNDHK